MTHELLRRVALVHGVLAWISAVALVALAVILVRLRNDARISRWIHLASAATTSLAVATFATGVWLDLPYRTHLRQRLFLASRSLGWLFERKLHLSFGALVFAGLALAALFAAGADGHDAPSRALRRASRTGYVASAFFALAACVIGTLVATRARF
ncbi:hypothetical protein [Polyangium jinanense]|uniref:Uncharacterized protein n=1 Tax=Polyangium jinanense TaxID=2829994 RepID=A0A9X3X2C7_9BACT|nr:hypothetical protein [Polyangium jinanense]MDC3954710.1 hypothetical protein [Polyangium jinanense]MDC3981013.1 hypothetical protein [Polyangium jinanense]